MKSISAAILVIIGLCSPCLAQTPIVACHIGYWMQLTSADVCAVLRHDTQPLLDVPSGSLVQNELIECQQSLARDLDIGGPFHNPGAALSNAAVLCQDIWGKNLQWAAINHRHIPTAAPLLPLGPVTQ